MIENKNDMSNNIERILCSAIHYNDELYYGGRPENIKSGYVVCGLRHSNCIILHSILTRKTTKSDDIQGFLTSNNRFVDRREAADIAYKAGQIKDIADCLISEDLY